MHTESARFLVIGVRHVGSCIASCKMTKNVTRGEGRTHILVTMPLPPLLPLFLDRNLHSTSKKSMCSDMVVVYIIYLPLLLFGTAGLFVGTTVRVSVRNCKCLVTKNTLYHYFLYIPFSETDSVSVSVSMFFTMNSLPSKETPTMHCIFQQAVIICPTCIYTSVKIIS